MIHNIKYEPYEVIEDDGTIHTFEMAVIPKGSFTMGDEHGDLWSACKPVQVGINIEAFELGKYPVTQALWEAVMDTKPSHFKGANRPIEKVGWKDAKDFIDRLNSIIAKGKSPEVFHLQSEAQWEYAARGGINKGPKYVGSNNIKEVAWYNNNSHRETKRVGLKQPNALGLYDMSGNIWEWCEDTWVDTLEGMPINGTARTDGEEGIRVVRGGSWINSDSYCRVAYRISRVDINRNVYVGFRLARY